MLGIRNPHHRHRAHRRLDRTPCGPCRPGTFDDADATSHPCCAAAGDLGLTPFVRVPEREYRDRSAARRGRPRDHRPAYRNGRAARIVSAALSFSPHGQRSQLSACRRRHDPTPAAQMNPVLDAITIVQILIETPLGVANVDAIAAVAGVDMVAIGATT